MNSLIYITMETVKWTVLIHIPIDTTHVSLASTIIYRMCFNVNSPLSNFGIDKIEYSKNI